MSPVSSFQSRSSLDGCLEPSSNLPVSHGMRWASTSPAHGSDRLPVPAVVAVETGSTAD